MKTDGIMTVEVEVKHPCSGYGSVHFESVYRGFESLLPSLKPQDCRNCEKAPRLPGLFNDGVIYIES